MLVRLNLNFLFLKLARINNELGRISFTAARA